MRPEAYWVVLCLVLDMGPGEIASQVQGTLMYEPYYGFREKPFTILPDPDLIYWGNMHRMAYTMLEFGVTNNAGFTVITGAIGCGKTTLLRHLLKNLSPNVTMGLISNSPQGRQ